MARSAFRRLARISIAAVIAWLPCGPAAAQGRSDRGLSLGAAVGIATPLHGDFDFTAGSWQLDLRFDTARFFASTVFFEQWEHTHEDVRTDETLFGPAGPLGSVRRISTRTVNRTRAVGWSLLAKSPGRVKVSGGAGVSYLLYSRDFSQRLTGCAPPSLCTNSSSEFNSNAFSAHVQAGVDVEVVRHVALMGQFRLLIPMEDPGSGHHSLVGGVRFLF